MNVIGEINSVSSFLRRRISLPLHASLVSSKIRVVPIGVSFSIDFVENLTGILSISEPGVNVDQIKVAFNSSLFPLSTSAIDFNISLFDSLLHAKRPIPFSPAFCLLYFLEIGFSSLSIVAIRIQVFSKVEGFIPEPLSSTIIVPPDFFIFFMWTIACVASASYEFFTSSARATALFVSSFSPNCNRRRESMLKKASPLSPL